MVTLSPITRGYVCVVLAVCIWAGWLTVSRFAVMGALTLWDVLAVRFITSGIILLPVVLRRGISIGPLKGWGGPLLALCMGCNSGLAVTGLMYAPVSHASTIINGTHLILATLAGVLIFAEGTTRLRMAGIVICLMGIGLMMVTDSAYAGTDQWVGHLLLMLSACAWASHTLLIRTWKASAVHAAAVVAFFSLCGYVPLYVFAEKSHLSWQHWPEIVFQAFYQGFLTAVVALIAFNKGVGVLGAARAGALTPLVPVLGTLFALVTLHETPSGQEWAGVLLVSTGVLLASGALRHNPVRRR